MIKKALIGVFLLICILIIGSSLYTWHIEKIDNIVRIEIQKYSESNLPANIIPGKVEFQLIPLNVVISNVKIIPKKELAKQINKLEVLKITARPSLLHLLIGKFHLAKIEVQGAKIAARLKIKKDSANASIQLRKILEQIPVTQLRISDIDLDLNVDDGTNNYALNASKINSIVTNDVNSLLVKFKMESLRFIYNEKTLANQAFFETSFFLTDKNIVLSDFKLKEKEAFIVASGSTQHNLAKKIISSGNFDIRSQVGLEKAHALIELFKKDEEKNPLDDLKGELRADLRVHFTGINKYALKIKTQLQGFTYQNFHVGDIDAEGQYDSATETVTGDKITLTNAGVKAHLSKVEMNIKELTFKNSNLNIEKFELFKFLDYAINNKIPADAKASGSVKCDGQLKNFRIDCSGSMTAEDMHVQPGKKPLIDLEQAVAEGTVSINDKEVTYNAQLVSGSSKGTSHGTINYKNGFDISYGSPNLNLTEIKKVSVLELEGIANVSGTTKGNSDAATFELHFDGKNIGLNQYKLGDITNTLKYKSGNVYVDKIQGSLVSSRYLGQLVIDLRKDTLVGKIQFPFVDLAIVKDSIKEHLPLPVDITGSGSAIINIDGPLDPDHLSFRAKSRLYNCKIDNQHIDTAEFDVKSVLGRMSFNSAYLEEKNSNMLFQGQILLDKKEYDLSFSSHRVLLDDITYSKDYSAPTKGIFQVEGKIKNSFKNPSLDLHFSSENFSLSGQKLSPILGDLKMTEAKNSMDVLGPNGLKLSYRDQKSSPDIHLEGTMQTTNLAPLITSLLDLQHIDDYAITTSSNFNLKINRNDHSKVSGYVFLPLLQFNLQKLDLKNEKEISIFLTNGKVNFAPFTMSGKGGKIQFTSASNSTSQVDVQVAGLFSLSFLQIFAPFLETLEGQTSVNFKIQNQNGKLNFLGSAFIEDGFIKLPEVQHAIEDLKVDVLFNQNQITINSIKGKFASGQLIGDGHIQLKGKKDLPTLIKVHLDNVDLNIPPQVNTLGSADLQLSGNWLPFLLSGTYQVSEGLITKEFSGSESKSTNPYQIFLPTALRDESVSPLRLDLSIQPLAPLKIKNSLIDGKMQGTIKVSGYPQAPILGGTINFTKNTQLNFRDVIFKVNDSSIVLTNSNPPNPQLYILAEARQRGYDIEMLVQGTAEKPKFKLSSQPSLTEPEIISLLTLGYTSADATTQANAAVGIAKPSEISGQSSLEIGSGLFSSNPLGKEFKNRFGFDVQVSSRFDSATSVAVPKISATKQFSERLTGVVSVQTGKDSRREGKLRYELNRGFAATMSLQSQAQEESNVQLGNGTSDILGIDLEFRKDFK
jgi:translocation and assembly module TamB